MCQERTFAFLRYLLPVPKVSEAHRAARREQIVDAARRCFLRDGFHATTMADVFAESGLSAGAVYRYFASKEDIISAIALEAIERVAGDPIRMIEADGAPPPLHEVVAAAVRGLATLDEENGTPRIAVQVWSEVQRSAVLRTRAQEIIGTVTPVFVTLLQRHRDAGLVPADLPVEPASRVLISLILGFIVQRVVLDLDAETYIAGLEGLLRPESLTAVATAGGQMA